VADRIRYSALDRSRHHVNVSERVETSAALISGARYAIVGIPTACRPAPLKSTGEVPVGALEALDRDADKFTQFA
jgi:hypothetical protein